MRKLICFLLTMAIAILCCNSALGLDTPSETRVQQLNCSDIQLITQSDNFASGILGESWFKQYYSFSDISYWQDSFAVSYVFTYSSPNFTISSDKLNPPHFEFNVGENCSDITLTRAWNLVRPFTVTISKDKAIQVITSKGYDIKDVHPSMFCFDTSDGNLDFRKPCWSTLVNSENVGFVDIESGEFSTIPSHPPSGITFAPSAKDILSSPLTILLIVLTVIIITAIIILARRKLRRF